MHATRSIRSSVLKWAVVTATLLATLALAATLAGADPVPGADEVPRVAIVATAGNFPDSLVAGPIAGALGGVVVLTPGSSLAAEAEDTLVAFDPDVVYIAGGTAAISAAVEAAVDAAGPWTVERKSGPGRVQTAAALNEIFDDLGVDRPALLADGQVVGDATIGGLVHVDDLAVEAPMVFTDTLDANVSLLGATSPATAKEILAVADLPAGEYVISGHAHGNTNGTDASRVICRVEVDGVSVGETINRIGLNLGQSSQATIPIVGHAVAAGPVDLEVLCHANDVTGNAPIISGTNNLTQIIVTRIP